MISYDNKECNEAINKLKEKGIEVVTFVSDSPNSKRLTFIGEDSIKAGKIAGKLMGLYLQGKGNVVIIGIHKILSCMNDRIKGFNESIEKFKDIKILEVIDNSELEDGEEGQYRKEIEKSIYDILKKHKKVDGIYVTNSFTGSVGKILEKNSSFKNIVLIGHENTDEIRELIKKDVVKATVYQQQYEEIVKSIEILYKKFTEEDEYYPKVQYIDLGILIKEKL
jgi:LacI family transcriptional regulator